MTSTKSVRRIKPVCKLVPTRQVSRRYADAKQNWKVTNWLFGEEMRIFFDVKVVVSKILGMFIPKIGEMIQVDEHIFQVG